MREEGKIGKKLLSEITKADELMKQGEKEGAHIILQGLLHERPLKRSICQDAINIYMVGNMYVEAKEVFRIYKNVTDKELTGTDFSLKEIEKEEQGHTEGIKEYGSQKVKIFRKPSLRESWCRPLCRIKEIQIFEDKIIFKMGSNEYSYYWSEILEACIERKQRRYGEEESVYVEKKCTIKTRNGRFQFDVTDEGARYAHRPNFKHPDILLAELNKHLNVVDKKIQKLNQLPRWYWISVVSIFLSLMILKIGNQAILLTVFFVIVVCSSIYQGTYKH